MRTPARISIRLLLLALIVGSTIGCDRMTKHIATTLLADKPTQSFLADTVRLGYAENAGGFLGLGADLPPLIRTGLFSFVTGVLLLQPLVSLLRSRWSPWRALALALFFAGGLSNWIDRLFHRHVVDFLNVGIGAFRTGIFNLADVAIMLGIALFVFTESRRSTCDAPTTRADAGWMKRHSGYASGAPRNARVVSLSRSLSRSLIGYCPNRLNCASSGQKAVISTRGEPPSPVSASVLVPLTPPANRSRLGSYR